METDPKALKDTQPFPPAPLFRGKPGEAKHGQRELLRHLLRKRSHQKLIAQEGFRNRIPQEPQDIQKAYREESKKLHSQIREVRGYYKRHRQEVPLEQRRWLRDKILLAMRIREDSQ